MFAEFLASVAKALVPLVAAGVALVLQAVSVDLGVETNTVIAGGIVTSFFTWLVKNVPLS
jgi:hypothetical protein